MNTHGTRRTQAERDAMTTEIGFALFSAALYSGAAFLVVILPVLYGLVSGGVRSGFVTAAGVVAAAVFVARTVQVLWRFGDRDPDAGRR